MGAFLLVAGGCLAPPAPNDTARPTLLNPRWQGEAFAEHLGFFQNAFADGTGPASEPVGRYVSARMKAAWLQPAVEERYRLWQAPGRPLGYVGYVGGKHPPVAQEAVLVCADLTREAPAAEAAALLEVARLYGVASQYTLMPERSVIFALWPHAASQGAGQDEPLAGLRAYLRQPTWRLDAVRAVIYVGLPAGLRDSAEALLAARGIALYRVEAPPPVVADTAEATASPVRAAVLRARALAQRTHERLRAATLTPGKMMPALGDTLRVPRAQRP